MTGYGAPTAGPPAAAKTQAPLFDLIGAGAGVVVFILGFFPWYGADGGVNVPGFGLASPGAAVVVMSLFAGLVAGAKLLDPEAKAGFVPLAGAVAALLVTLGLLIDKGGDKSPANGYSIKIGLILALIVTLIQVGAFAYSWLQSSGKISSGGGASASQWGAPSSSVSSRATASRSSRSRVTASRSSTRRSPARATASRPRRRPTPATASRRRPDTAHSRRSPRSRRSRRSPRPVMASSHRVAATPHRRHRARRRPSRGTRRRPATSRRTRVATARADTTARHDWARRRGPSRGAPSCFVRTACGAPSGMPGGALLAWDGE